jgi:hypothetical protein
MTKQIAERPVTVSFQDDSSCTFDSNDFVEFEILTHDLPMGEIVFKGSPFTDAGLTELGRCVFNYFDHGLYVYQELANMLYKAQHPWLDFRDAVEHRAFHKNSWQMYRDKYMVLQRTDDNMLREVIGSGYEVENLSFNRIKAVKPLGDELWQAFKEVKVWQPLETVL